MKGHTQTCVNTQIHSLWKETRTSQGNRYEKTNLFSSTPYCTRWRSRSWPAAVTPGPRCPPALPGEWGRCLAVSPRWCRRRTPAVWSQCPFGSFWQRCGAACSHSAASGRDAVVRRRRWALRLPPAPLDLYWWSNILSIIWYLVSLFGIFITSTS